MSNNDDVIRKLDDKKRIPNIGQKISRAKTTESIMDLIRRMPQTQFEDRKTKSILAKKFKSMKENFLSKKVTSSKSKKQFMKIIK